MIWFDAEILKKEAKAMEACKKAFIFILIFLLTGCSTADKTIPDAAGPVITPRSETVIPALPSPEATVLPSNTPFPEKDSGTESGTAIEQERDDGPVLHNDKYLYQYFNYINKLPIAEILDRRYTFSYDGMVSISDQTGEDTSNFHIKDKVKFSQYEDGTFTNNDWYYMGYLLSEDAFYLRYDSIGITSYSFLIKMELSGKTMDIHAAAPYSEIESMNNFILIDHVIYYTSNQYIDSTLVVTLMQSAYGGLQALHTFDENVKVQYLFPYNNALYMICESSDSVQSLWMFDRIENQLLLLQNDCEAQFLYIYEDFAIFGIYQDTHLYYYSLTDHKYRYLRLAENKENYFSVPHLSEEGLYVAIYSWEDQENTKLARLDLKNTSIDKYIQFGRRFYHTLGITGDIVYLEESGTCHSYSIATGEELS